MPTEVKLPHLGESIDSSVILAWHKQVGDVVKRGDELADLETDKATLSLEAPKNGVLLAIVAEVGQTVYLGDLLAVIGKKGETWSEARTEPEQESVSISTVESTVSIPTENTDLSPTYKISPVARRKAKALGINLADIVPADGAKKVAPMSTTTPKQKPRQKTLEASGASNSARSSGSPVSVCPKAPGLCRNSRLPLMPKSGSRSRFGHRRSQQDKSSA